MSAPSLYWYDYETFGSDPRRDRIAQFAGIRTDLDLNIVGQPCAMYCQPANDFLPHPDACLVTGITPQQAKAEGLLEAAFVSRLHAELSQPNTCSSGYNTIRFDDEFTRQALYRNFYDPYAREWRDGNSRWDLIDIVRLARALRPEGIDWPSHEDGRPSFKLEHLTAANGIDHAGAHDALVDVHATIALACLLKQRQPRLFQFTWQNRDKKAAADALQLGSWQPLLHVSEKYAAARYCLAVVVALARHPRNANEIIVYDLAEDPQPLLDLTIEGIRQRLFTAVANLPEGISRIPLKTVRLNRCPVLVPFKTLRPRDAERLQIDLGACQRHLQLLQHAAGLPVKVQQVFEQEEESAWNHHDPELAIYSGGFFKPGDRARMDFLRTLSPTQLAQQQLDFEDVRLPELLFRYRARNYPDTLTGAELERWETYRQRRLTDPQGGEALLRKASGNACRSCRHNTSSRVPSTSFLKTWQIMHVPFCQLSDHSYTQNRFVQLAATAEKLRSCLISR